MIKAVRTENNQPVVVEEMQVLAPSMAVTGLVIHRRSADAGGGGFGGGGSTSEPRLVVSSPAEIVSIKLQRCKVYTCRCVGSRVGFYWVLLAFTGFSGVFLVFFLVFLWFNMVLLGLTGFDWVELGFAGFNWV